MPVDTQTLRTALDHTLDELPPAFDRLGHRYSGKVRENFTTDHERIIVVSDRVSAFDVVLGTIPFKGQVLNGLATHWFELARDRFPNHLLGVPDPQAVRAIECDPIPVEIVVRGYLTGTTSTSIWRAYERGERVFCGHLYHQQCLFTYMKIPPFDNKKCHSCGVRISHHKWKLTDRLAEDRWAHEQARERELAEVEEFFQ